MAARPHELARLDALAQSRILDTSPEAEFDDLLKVATSATQCPMAMLCFVDEERLWLKSGHGLSVRELPRAGSFCGAAIEQDGPLVVPDASLEPRFAAQPLVTEAPFVRFYAGAPLLEQGYAIGTLAVLDSVPRTFSDEQQNVLSTLARTACSLLSLRRLREERLLKTEALLRSATRISGIGCWQWNLDSGEITWSSEMFPIFGLPLDHPVSMTTFQDHLHPEDLAIVQERTLRAMEGKMTTFPDYRIVRSDGEVRVVQATAELERDAHGRAALLTGALFDITDRITAERAAQQLTMKSMHGQKLESLGVLAAGVAHDFNNLLVGVLGNAELAAADETLTVSTRDCIERVVEAAGQAAGLTRQLLAYTGGSPMATAEVDLSAHVAPIVELLRATIPKSVVLTCVLPDQLPAIRADVDQLQQISMNLIMNSAESYDRQLGEVLVRTYLTTICRDESHDLIVPTPLVPGSYVVLEVRDLGAGMTRATLERVFEPFFSTKFTGRGLGLSAVLGIARSHSAVLTVDSEPGHGSRFRVHFPALDRVAAKPSRAKPERSSPAALQGRTVLVVDDEARVRSLENRVLGAAGMTVLEAQNGGEAIALLSLHRERVDVVVLDLVMPGLDSASTLHALRGLRPDLPVLLQSGYSEEEATLRMREIDGRVVFLQKPFSPRTLLAKIGSLLAPGHAGSTRS